MTNFLLSCDSTTCSFWNNSGGKKGQTSLLPSDRILRCSRFCSVMYNLLGSISASLKASKKAENTLEFLFCSIQQYQACKEQCSPDALVLVWGVICASDDVWTRAVEELGREVSFLFPKKDFILSKHCSANFTIFSTSTSSISPTAVKERIQKGNEKKLIYNWM